MHAMTYFINSKFKLDRKKKLILQHTWLPHELQLKMICFFMSHFDRVGNHNNNDDDYDDAGSSLDTDNNINNNNGEEE